MSEVMTPTEFVLWLNGAISMLKGPPSTEQWTKVQENLHPIIAKMMAEKLMGTAEEVRASKIHKDQIAQIQKEMQYGHALEIERIKRTYDPTNPMFGVRHTGVGIAAPPLNTGWVSTVPRG